MTRLAWLITGVFILAALAIYSAVSAEVSLAQEKENFVSAVTHELRTPLTSIKMYADLLQSGWVENEEVKKAYYEHLQTESDRLSRLVTNVLSLAGLNRKDSHSARVITQPSKIIDKVYEISAPLAAKAGFELRKSFGQECEACTLETESSSLEQILINFIENALKFASDSNEKAIILGCRAEPKDGPRKLVFFVRDFGKGVSSDAHERVFELFYRAGNENVRTHKGAGIGLALVKKLAQFIGADVGVSSATPGAEFWVSFGVQSPGDIPNNIIGESETED